MFRYTQVYVYVSIHTYIHTTYVHTCPTKNEILQTSDASPVIMNVNVNDPSFFVITHSAAEWCSHSTV